MVLKINKCALFLCLVLSGLRVFAGEADYLGSEYYLKGDHAGLFEYYLQNAEKKPGLVKFAAALNKQIFESPKIIGEKLRAQLESASDGRVTYYLRQMLAEQYFAGGDYMKAKEQCRLRGVISDWSIAGPFGRYGKADFYESFWPENGAEYNDQDKWRRITEAGVHDFDPWQWVRRKRGVVYLYTEFYLPGSTQVRINVRTHNAFKLILDKRVSAVADKISGTLPYEIAAGLRSGGKSELQAGWHSILLKLYAPAVNSKIEVTLTDNNLQAIEGIKFGAGNVLPEKVDGRLVLELADFEQYQNNPEAVKDAKQAAYQAKRWQVQGCYDLALKLWEIALKLDSKNGAYWAQRGECEKLCYFIPEARRESLAFRSNSEAVKINPGCVPALVALGEYEKRGHNYKKAQNYFDEALKTNGSDLSAWVAGYRMAKDNGWDVLAQGIIKKINEKFPDSLSAGILAATQSYLSISEMAARLAVVGEKQRQNVSVLDNLIKAYLSIGELEKAERALELFLPYSQKSQMVFKLRAKIELAKNNYAKAAEYFEQAARSSGGNVGSLKQAGFTRLLLATDEDKKQALGLFKEVLKISPQEHDIRRLVYDLENKNYRFWQKYAIDYKEKINEYIKSEKPLGRTARLIDQTILTVYPDGSYVNYTHELQNVLSPSGVKQAAVIDTYGELISAQTILPKRKISLEPIVLPGQNKLTMPALSVGAFTEHSYLQQQPAAADKNLYFPNWFFRSPDREETFLFSQYIVRVMPGAAFKYELEEHGSKIQFQKFEEEDGVEVYSWTGKNMPRAIHEEGGLAITEALPLTAVSGDQNWQGVNNLLMNYYISRVIPTFHIRDKARELTAGARSEKDKIAALYYYVCREIENTSAVAPASYIMEQHSGDRNLLLLSLLEALKIKARFVAIRPSDKLLYKPIWKLPSANIFTNYMVLAEDENGRRYWLDTRYKYGRFGFIPEDIAGATAFVVDKNGGDFTTLKDVDLQANCILDKRGYTLDKNVISLSGRKIIPDLAGIKLKEKLVNAKPQLRHSVIEKVIGSGLTGLELKEFSLPGLDQSDEDFVCAYSAQLYNAISRKRDGFIGVPLGLSVLPLLPKKDFINRRTPYHFTRNINIRDVYEYELPQMEEVVIPKELLIKNRFGYYKIGLQRNGQKVVIRRDCSFQPQRIGVAHWKDFYAMAKKIEEAESALLWWK